MAVVGRRVHPPAIGLVVAAAIAGCAKPSSTAPTPAATTEPASAGCAKCHADATREWEASLHRRAFDDRDFQIAFRAEPLDFCFRCHAPEARDRADARGASMGVGCTSCHDAPAAHAERRARATTTRCEGCHELTFPGRSELLQSTGSEHAASPFASVACAECHAPPRAGGGHDHRFAASRDPGMLRRAVPAPAVRIEGGAFVVHLAPGAVGHAVPTGDLFRALVVRVFVEDDRGISDAREIRLERVWDPARAPGARCAELADSRLTGERDVAFPLDSPTRVRRVFWSVVYERGAFVRAGAATPFDRTVLHEDTLEVSR